MSTVRVFEYLDRLDAFVVTDEYSLIAERLGLAEWNPVVWIGRLFTLDNDYGEHWFDNWDERADLDDGARGMGIPSEQLMIVVPDRFENGENGPCHPPALRKRFWNDVLRSLELSHDTLSRRPASVTPLPKRTLTTGSSRTWKRGSPKSGRAPDRPRLPPTRDRKGGIWLKNCPTSAPGFAVLLYPPLDAFFIGNFSSWLPGSFSSRRTSAGTRRAPCS